MPAMRRFVFLCLLALAACPPRTGPAPTGNEKPRVEMKKVDKADEALKAAARHRSVAGQEEGH